MLKVSDIKDREPLMERALHQIEVRAHVARAQGALSKRNALKEIRDMINEVLADEQRTGADDGR